MTRSDCPRLFEAEARRDGRLTGVERTSFERHLATCPACAREVDALEALAAQLRDRAAEPGTDELHARRERMRLLAAFERSRLAPEPRYIKVRRFWPALAAAVCLVVFGAVWLRSRAQTAAPASASAVIRAHGTAAWSRQVDEHVERVFLSEGTLHIHRAHGASAPRLLVILPDGELEDIGTTFTVSARAGRTTHVAVEEGRVVLRLRDRAPVMLARGGTFTAPALAPAASVQRPFAEPDASASPRATAPPVAKSRALAAASSRVGSAPAGEPDESAAREFRAATAALDAGDNGAAAAAFARFIARYGRDARAEDAAYLRVIALQRSGNVGATRSAASEYLRRYPKGFRRAEIEALLGE